MSRPSKHRAWDKVDKRMIVDEQDFIPLMVTNKGVFRLSPHHAENLWELMDTDRFELMQSTGLQDRNGKEIYEGDIVKQTYVTQSGNVHDGTDMTFSGHHVGKVVITARGVCLKNPLHYSDDTDESSYMNAYKQVAGYRSEVIGNAFDHPHLLKGDDSK